MGRDYGNRSAPGKMYEGIQVSRGPVSVEEMHQRIFLIISSNVQFIIRKEWFHQTRNWVAKLQFMYGLKEINIVSVFKVICFAVAAVKPRSELMWLFTREWDLYNFNLYSCFLILTILYFRFLF